MVQLPLGGAVVVVLAEAGFVVLVGAIVAPGAVVVADGTVVVAGGTEVVTVLRPCLGTVVTVVPSAIMNCVVSGSSSPMVVTPVTETFQSPGAKKRIPISSVMRAAPGRVSGTLSVYPEKLGFSGVKVTTKF